MKRLAMKRQSVRRLVRRLAGLGCAAVLVMGLPLAAQTQGRLELTSGLGRPLYSLPDDKAEIDARTALAADPKSVEKVLALAKAQAARKQYREAVATATMGLAFAPESADLYLERGHRELGLREFAAAKKDLEQAAKLAPALNEVFYHLALAHYFMSEFREAAENFERSRQLAKTSDNVIDCTNWEYASWRRAGDEAAANVALSKITEAVKNDSPHGGIYLSLDHFYQGKITEADELPPMPAGPEDAEANIKFSTVGYAIGNWRLYHGDKQVAMKLFREVVQDDAWNAWGFIGSETELVRAQGTTLVKVMLEPASATATIGGSVQFHATVTGAADTTVMWSVSDPPGTGKSGVRLRAGTISPEGLYQTPYPAPASVTVTARSTADASAKSSVTVLLKTPTRMAGPALTVDTSAVVHAISPLVYGMNEFSMAPALQAQVHVPVNRWGGDGTTRYNYRLDVTNSADDWYFENSNNKNTAYPDVSEVNTQVEQDKLHGSVTMVTVPLIGFTTKRVRACSYPVSLYPAQQKIEPYGKQCGNGKLPNGKDITGNDSAMTSMPIDERFVGGWVQYLVKRFGDAAHGGVRIYELDNEPEYWSGVHRDVHPEAMSYDEVTNKGLVYAKTVKAADPTALVAGPVISNWGDFFYSMTDIRHGWSTGPCYCFNGAPVDRLAHGNVPLLAYYLQHFKKAEADGGVRLLDYLDLHTYFAAKDAAFKPAGDTALQAARLDSTRALWDPTYRDPESTDPEAAVRKNKAQAVAPQLIPLMRRLVAENYPGTKLAITEYNWGGMESMNGALAQAEIMALFGREGLDVGTLWGPPDPVKELPGLTAFKFFESYDGAGGKFGDGSLRAASSDQSKLAIYAAERSSDDMLTVMVLNKSFGELTANVEMQTKAKSAQVYQYSDANLSAIARVGDAVVAGDGKGPGRLAASFPAQSITLFVLSR